MSKLLQIPRCAVQAICLISAIAVLLVPMALMPTTALGDDTAVTTEIVNLRSGPRLDAPTLVEVPQGSTVSITGEAENNYIPVEFDGTAGWIAADYIAPAGDSTSSANNSGSGASLTKSVHLRAEPERESESLRRLPSGTSVILLGEEENGYVKVQVGNDTGWVMQKYLDSSGAEMPQVPTGDRIVSDLVNFRQSPSASSTSLALLTEGARVTPIGAPTDGYLNVKYHDQAGWISEEYLVEAEGYIPDELPVLMFHNIGEPDDYTVTSEQMVERIKWLAENDYVTVTPSDLVAWIENRTPLPERAVMITVDDGWRATLDIDAELRKYGFKGTYFIHSISEMSPEDIRKLRENGEICGHTVSHHYLDEMDQAKQTREIVDNKVWLEEVIGEPVTCFAYPFGNYDASAVEVVQNAGFQIAFDPWWGQAPLNSELNRWHVPRINMSGEMDLETFLTAISIHA